MKLDRHIAHAGGLCEGLMYSNSLEAVLFSSARTGLIELDIVPALDGLIVAHDGLEKAYGLSDPFSETTVRAFRQTLFKRKLTALSFMDLAELANTLDAVFVLDVKPVGDEYQECIREIADACRAHGSSDKFVIQVYLQEDFDYVSSNEFRGVMIALWKNFGDIFKDKAFAFVDYCRSLSHFDFTALSIRYRRPRPSYVNLDRPEFQRYLDMKLPIYVHGQSRDEEPLILDRGLGIFTRDVEAR